MDPTIVQELHTLLEHCLSPDTATIKAATAQLNLKYYKSWQCIPGLYQIAASSDNQGARQLASTELRKRILAKDGKLWTQVPADMRGQMKTSLLDRMMNEPSKIVRHSLARALLSIAELELPLPTSAWPTLLPSLSGSLQSASLQEREMSIYALYLLIDVIQESAGADTRRANESWAMMCGMFERALGDQGEEVRVDGLKGLGKLAEYVEPDQKELIKKFQSLLPLMLSTLSALTFSADPSTEHIKHGLDVFETLLIIDVPLISKHIAEYTDLCLRIAGGREVDEEVRCAALNSLCWTIQYKKSKVQSLGLAGVIIEKLLPIGTESEPEDDDEDAPGRLSFRALDELAKALPPQHVFPVLSPQLQQYMSSPDPRHRKAALMAFGVTIEGVSEYIRPHIDQLWPLIFAGLNDPEPIVRRAGCIALACLCEWLQEECADKHAEIVPLLFNLISDSATQKSATACLEAYLEILGEKIGGYLDLLMQRLVVLLETAPDSVKAAVTGAIGSAAFASKEAFRPYFNETAQRLAKFLLLEGEGDAAALRGVAMDTLGTFAEVVGKDMFRPYFADMMKYAIESVSSESSRARETSFLFFGTMAGVFEGEFAPYLAQTVPPLLVSCMQSEANQFEEDDEGNATPGAAQQAVAAFNAAASSSKITANGDESDDEADIDDLDAMFNGVNSEIAVEKEIATEVIGQIFEATKADYMPYLDETIKILLEKMLDHYYEGIRKSAISSLMTIIKTFYEMSDPVDWEGMSAVDVTPPLNTNVNALIDMILPKILESWSNEDDKQVVIQLCAALSEVINTLGPSFLTDERRRVILTYCMLLLQGQADCQQDDLDGEEAGDDVDSSEYESVLISNAVDVVSAMASVLKARFAPEFSEFLPLITKYYDPKRSTSERSMTIGSIGEIIVGLGSGITQFTEPILVVLSHALADPEAEVRSNAAFASGAMIQWSDVDLTSQYVPLLGALQPYFNVNEQSTRDQLNAKDNAAGAIARMITKSSTSLPLDSVLPIFFGALPLKTDPIENKACFEAIFHIFESRPDLAMQHIDHLIAVFAYVLNASRPDDLQEETKDRLMQLIVALHNQVPEKIRAAGIA